MLGKITTGFQITLPLNFRRENNINIGDYIEISSEANRLVIAPVKINHLISRDEALEKFNKIFAKKITSVDFSKKSEDEVIKIVKKEIKKSRKSKK